MRNLWFDSFESLHIVSIATAIKNNPDALLREVLLFSNGFVTVLHVMFVVTES